MKPVSIIISLIIIILFIPGLAENYDQYKILPHLESITVFSFYNGDTISFQSTERMQRWERDEQVVATLSQDDYSCLNYLVRVIQIDDKQYGILMKDTREELSRIEYWVWSEQTIELIRAWESKKCFSAYCDKGFLVFDSEDCTVLYDRYANELWRGNLSESNEYRPFTLKMRSADDWVCALNDHCTNEPYNACVRVIEGQIAWCRRFVDYDNRIIHMLPLLDGWTIVVLSRNDGQYGPIKIITLDQKGDIDSIDEISMDEGLLVSSSLLLEAEDGTILIYGRAVDLKQTTCLVWKLRYDAQSDSCIFDIRDGRYHGDYSPLLTIGNTGQIDETTVFVKLLTIDGSNAPSVLVPFEELPTVTEYSLNITSLQ